VKCSAEEKIDKKIPPFSDEGRQIVDEFRLRIRRFWLNIGVSVYVSILPLVKLNAKSDR
jgi:hypothetical protein